MSPEHIAHPYPTEPEKAQIMADTGIELKQLTNWFVNNRKRYWKPRVEARLQQQARAAAAAAQAHAAAVAVATASVHTNPVSPDQGFKPTLTIPPPTGNGFVSFDLASSPVASPTKRRASSLSYHPHQLVATCAAEDELEGDIGSGGGTRFDQRQHGDARAGRAHLGHRLRSLGLGNSTARPAPSRAQTRVAWGLRPEGVTVWPSAGESKERCWLV